MGDITSHFSRDEFGLPEAKAKRRGCEPAEYPQAWVKDRLQPLCEALEVLRAELGGHPFTIISAYRPLPYNRALGSQDTSQHVQGRAADFQVAGVAPAQVYAVALRLQGEGKLKIGGLGVYDEFCHLDVRGDKFRSWDRRSR